MEVGVEVGVEAGVEAGHSGQQGGQPVHGVDEVVAGVAPPAQQGRVEEADSPGTSLTTPNIDNHQPIQS